MPSKTPRQRHLMQMCSSDEGRKNATVKCPSKKVAREFAAADKKKGR